MTNTIDEPQLKKRKMETAPTTETVPLAPVANLLIKKHSDKAKLPTRGSPLSAGYDLYRSVEFCPSWIRWYEYVLYTVLNARLYLRMARLSLTRKYQSRSPQGHMDAWHQGAD